MQQAYLTRSADITETGQCVGQHYALCDSAHKYGWCRSNSVCQQVDICAKINTVTCESNLDTVSGKACWVRLLCCRTGISYRPTQCTACIYRHHSGCELSVISLSDHSLHNGACKPCIMLLLHYSSMTRLLHGVTFVCCFLWLQVARVCDQTMKTAAPLPANVFCGPSHLNICALPGSLDTSPICLRCLTEAEDVQNRLRSVRGVGRELHVTMLRDQGA